MKLKVMRALKIKMTKMTQTLQKLIEAYLLKVKRLMSKRIGKLTAIDRRLMIL
jgi:hypothetical protein